MKHLITILFIGLMTLPVMAQSTAKIEFKESELPGDK